MTLATPDRSRHGGAVRRDDRIGLWQFPLRHLIKVIAMKVRQQDKIQGRNIYDVHERIRRSSAMHPMVDIYLLVLMNEGGLSQDGQSTIPNEYRSVTDGKYRKLSWIVES